MTQYQIVTTGCGGYVIQYRENSGTRWHRLEYSEIYSFLFLAKLKVWMQIREDAARAERFAHVPKVVWGPHP